MTTIADLRRCCVGQPATVQYGELVFAVTCLDVKISYNRTRYLVEPIAGSGIAWVESVTFS